MGFWTKMGAAVGGVAAGVLAPMTFGASIIIGGAVGATAGAAAGQLIDKDEQKKGYQKGKEEAKAEAAIQIKILAGKLKNAYESLKHANEHYQFMIALEAVGMAVANATGQNSDDTKQEIEEFIAGISGNALPDKVKIVFDKYRQTPPSMNEAIFEVRKVQRVTPDIFKDVVRLALDDAVDTQTGKKILEVWDNEFA